MVPNCSSNSKISTMIAYDKAMVTFLESIMRYGIKLLENRDEDETGDADRLGAPPTTDTPPTASEPVRSYLAQMIARQLIYGHAWSVSMVRSPAGERDRRIWST